MRWNGIIDHNPVKSIKWTEPKPSRAIDRRRVANPVQARTILLAGNEVRTSKAVSSTHHLEPRVAERQDRHTH